MKKKFDKNTSLIIIISLILLLLNVGFGIMFLSKSRETVKSIIYNRMMNISSIAASIIDGDDLESITQEDVDNKTEKYTKIYDTLSSFQSNNQNQFKYIYSIRDNGDKTFSFIIDPDTESPGEFGEEIVYTDALYQASLGTPSIDKTASEDRWGSFYSAFTPVFDSQGKVAGIIGIDFESGWYEQQITKFEIYFLISSVISLLVGASIAFLLSIQVRRKFRKLNSELTELSVDLDNLTKEIAPESQKEEDDVINNSDEISLLGKKISIMQKDLQIYIDHIHAQAYIDAMTGVHNKTAYLELVKKIDEKIVQSNTFFSVVVFDLNGLKLVNDNYGHERGDTFIINSAKVISKIFGVDNTFRIGGDEFIVILENKEEKEVQSLFDSIDSEVKYFNSTINETETPVSFSAGVAYFNKEVDREFKSVFKRADDAMYYNKGIFYMNHKDLRNKNNM